MDKYTFEIIESVNSHGKKTFYRIWVDVLDHAGRPKPITDAWMSGSLIPAGYVARIVTEYWVDGSDKVKTSINEVKEGKNIGKKNETNIVTQAVSQASTKWKNQSKKSTSSTITDYVRPMLASTAPPKDWDAITPYLTDKTWVQRKYNGVRALGSFINGKWTIWSRKLIVFGGVNYIVNDVKVLLEDYPTVVLDGELYKHGLPLQDITSIARGQESQERRVEYIVYDLYDTAKPNMVWSDRLLLLNTILNGNSHRISYTKLAPTYEVAPGDILQLKTLYMDFIKEGYEGAMLRLNGQYKVSYNDYRSKHLIKLKPTLDSEFEIVGWKVGETGKTKGALILICAYNNIEFSVSVTNTTIEKRVELAKQMPRVFDRQYKGKMLRVYYDELSKDGIPLRGRTHLEIID